jgi:hypothetical protein
MYKEARPPFSQKKPLTFRPGRVMDVRAGRETAQKAQPGRAGKAAAGRKETPMKTQTFGIEIEMNHITRQRAAQVVAETLGEGATFRHTGGSYDAWEVTAPDKPLMDVEISSCDAYPTFTYRLMGTQGGLNGDMTKIDWKYYKPEESPRRELIRTPLHDEQFTPLYCTEKLFWYEQSWHIDNASTFTLATGRLYDTVYKHLTEGAPLVVTPQQVRTQIHVMEEAHRQNPLSRLD